MLTRRSKRDLASRSGLVGLLLALVLVLVGALARPSSRAGARLPPFPPWGAPAGGATGLTEPSSGGAGAPLAVGEAIRRLHLAWSPERAGFEGGHSTYAARATESGVAVTPVAHRRDGARASVARGTPLRVETTSIARDQELFRQGDPSGRVGEDGVLSFRRGSSVERLRNTEDGVEQSWLFERRPEGEGDLVVRLRVSGQDYAGETPAGLHFTDPRTKLGVRYGHATFIDARGERTDVRARYVDGHIELRVPDATVVAAAYPAVLDPILGPELGVGETEIGLDAAFQVWPAIACGQEACLAVWLDYRGGWYSIRAARVTYAGVLIDNTGFTLSSFRNNSASGANLGTLTPVVTLGDDGYLVLWNELRDVGVETHGALVSSSPIASSPVLKADISIPIEKTGPNPRSLALAFDSSAKSYLVAWDGAIGEGIGALRLSVTGKAPGAGEPFMLSGPIDAVDPAAACGGASCLVTWSTFTPALPESDIFAALISPQGVGSPVSLTAGVGLHERPSVVFNGTSYVVVWQRTTPWSSGDIYGARIDQFGNVDIAETKIGEGARPEIAFDSATQLHVATWTSGLAPDSQNIVSARIKDTSGALEVLDPVVVVDAGFSYGSPEIACGVVTCFIVWDYAAPEPFASADIRGRAVEVNPSDLLLPDWIADLSLSPNAQQAPAVAFDSDKKRFLIVWREDGGFSGSSLHHASLELGDIEPFDAGFFAFNAHVFSAPAIAYGNKSYFVTWLGHGGLWEEEFSIFGQFLTADGSVDVEKESIIFQSFTNLAQLGSTAVASDGSGYLVAWFGPSSSGVNRIYVAGVSPSGKLLQGSGAMMAASGNLTSPPVIAYDGENYLVVWAVSEGIRAARVSTAGDAVLIRDTALINIASTGKISKSPVPAVAYDGENYLVVWIDNPSGAFDDNRIYGTRVSRLGFKLDDGFEISRAGEPSDAWFPAVTFDGSHYLVVWKGAVAGGQSLLGAWVGRDGAVFPTAIEDSSAVSSHYRPALASDGAGRTLLAYSRMFFEDEDGARFDVERVRVRSATNACVPTPPECSSVECMLPGTCDPETMTCAATVAKPKGAACEGGFCISGTCVAVDSASSSSQSGVGAGGGSPPGEAAAGCSCATAGSRSGTVEGLSALALLCSAGALGRLRRNKRARLVESRA